MSSPGSPPPSGGRIEVETTDGVTIAVHDLGGDREASTLVICHATGFCGRAYGPLAEALASRYHVLAVDFRGHGDSTRPENGNFDWPSMSDDLLAVLDRMTASGGIAAGQAVYGFGHSLGGGLLLLAEARRPGTLDGAYLFEPIVLPDLARLPPGTTLAPDDMSSVARKRRPSFASKQEALMRYASRPPLAELQAGSLAAYVEHGMSVAPDGTAFLKCRPEDEAATFEAPGKPTMATVSSVKTPTTVAIGTTSAGWSPALLGPALAEALPNGRLERHDGLGHFGPLQSPALVASRVLAALG